MICNITKCRFHILTTEKDSPQIISILRDPAAAERVLLDLLGPADTRIIQEYIDGDLKQNLAHHALAVSDCRPECHHFSISVLV